MTGTSVAYRCISGYSLKPRLSIVYTEGAGGNGPFATTSSSAEIFDVERNAWTTMAASPRSRFRMGSAVLQDGRLLSISGSSFTYWTTNLAYNPLTNVFTFLAPVPSPRMNGGAGVLPDGRVFFLGGYNQAITPLSSMIYYFPSNNTWGNSAPSAVLTVARSRLAAVVLPDGRIFVAGGINDATAIVQTTVEISDANYTRFIQVAPLSSPRAALSACVMADGNVMVMGGRDTQNRLDYAFDLVEVYNVSSNSWSARASLHTPRWGASAFLLPDGRIAVVGGYDGANAVGTIEFYFQNRNLWVQGASMAVPREFGGVGLVLSGVSFCNTAVTPTTWTPPPTCEGSLYPNGRIANGRIAISCLFSLMHRNKFRNVMALMPLDAVSLGIILAVLIFTRHQ